MALRLRLVFTIRHKYPLCRSLRGTLVAPGGMTPADNKQYVSDRNRTGSGKGRVLTAPDNVGARTKSGVLLLTPPWAQREEEIVDGIKRCHPALDGPSLPWLIALRRTTGGTGWLSGYSVGLEIQLKVEGSNPVRSAQDKNLKRMRLTSR